MSERVSGSRRLATSRSYQALLNDIAALYTQTRASVVRMYWEIGRRIVEVEQAGESRAEYGGRLVPRLAADLTKRFGIGFSERNLWRMRALYLQQKILPVPAELSWTHRAELLSLPDARLRQRLAARAQEQGLTSQELRALVQQARQRLVSRTAVNGTPAAPPELLTPTRGTVGLFRIRDLAQARCLDLGFESYRALTKAQAHRLKAGDVVRLVEKKGDGSLFFKNGTGSLFLQSGKIKNRYHFLRTVPVPEATLAQLYTYEAQIERVVDGDTMWTLIRLTESEWRREKLRLRGIDCPELGSAAGEAAKRFVQAQAARATRVVITTTKPDKWDRYLSDVFLAMPDGAELFLNNRLLEVGHARPYAEVSLEDWETG